MKKSTRTVIEPTVEPSGVKLVPKLKFCEVFVEGESHHMVFPDTDVVEGLDKKDLTGW